MAVKLSKILENDELSLKQFSPEAINALEERIQEKDLGEGIKPYAQCIIRNKLIYALWKGDKPYSEDYDKK